MNLKADKFGTAQIRLRLGILSRFLIQFAVALLYLSLRKSATIVDASAHFSWPNGRIPYLDDLALIADPDQAVALNNARMDLQVRTCVRFYPRRLERDFVFFTDLGPQVECWNMFDHTKGRVEVNAGPSCLEPMRRPHRPHRVFSDCDIEYVNHLYNCPRRRSASPICPPGQNIMSRPQPVTTMTTAEITKTTTTMLATTTTTTTTITTTTETTPQSMTESLKTNTVTEGPTNSAAFTDEEFVEYESHTTQTQQSNYGAENNSIDRQQETTEQRGGEDPSSSENTYTTDENGAHYGIGEAGEETNGYHRNQKIISNGVDYGRRGNEKKANRIDSAGIMTTQHPDWHNSREETEEEWETSHVYETSTAVVDPIFTDDPAMEKTTVRPSDESTYAMTAEEIEEESTVTITTIPQPPFPTLLHTSSLDMVTVPTPSSSNYLPETGAIWQPSLPMPHTQLMMTLITTPSTTTTTFAPPPPDWVKSVEASFESRQNGEKEDMDSSTLPPPQPLPTIVVVDSHGHKEQTTGSNMAGVEIVDYAGAGATAMGLGNNIIAGASTRSDDDEKRDQKPMRPSVIGEYGSGGRNSQILLPLSAREYEKIGGDADRNIILTGSSRESANPNGEYSVSQTKVITTIEKSKYIGPCGSACSYSGDLVKLYRSYNEKSEITDHFYTTDRLEHHLMATQGYTMKPHIGHLGRNHIDPLCSCLKPLYRLYNDFMKDHLLTSTEQEKDMAERILGYKFERVLGFCTKEPGCGAYVPLYRFYNPIAKDHLYTSDQQEMHYYKTHPEQAYGFESIECYVWQHNSSTKGCPALMLSSAGGGAGVSAEEFARL